MPAHGVASACRRISLRQNRLESGIGRAGLETVADLEEFRLEFTDILLDLR